MFRGSILDEYRIGYGQTINLGWVGDDTNSEAIQHVSPPSLYLYKVNPLYFTATAEGILSIKQAETVKYSV
jgi:hypothetical protein